MPHTGKKIECVLCLLYFGGHSVRRCRILYCSGFNFCFCSLFVILVGDGVRLRQLARREKTIQLYNVVQTSPLSNGIWPMYYKQHYHLEVFQTFFFVFFTLLNAVGVATQKQLDTQPFKMRERMQSNKCNKNFRNSKSCPGDASNAYQTRRNHTRNTK